MSKNQAGKGDKPRPIDKKIFDQNFDQIVWDAKNAEKKSIKTKKGKTTYNY
jgi:hypothetical protein